MLTKKLLFIGYGDIAGRSSRQLTTNGYHCTALSRSPKPLPPGSEQWLGDVRSPEILARIQATPFDAAIITLTPSERGDEGYKAAYVDTLNALHTVWKHSAPKLIIFVSSTSVYGQHQHEWVDENSPADASKFSGQRIIEAEQRLLDLALLNPATTPCIVRFSGIYGPGRDHLLRQVVAGKGGTDTYTNRIHVEDCAGVISYLVEQFFAGTPLQHHYLASDCEPVTAREIREWIAAQMGRSPEQLSIDTDAPTRAGSKRCNNQRLLQLGYRFVYPSYRDGYASIIKNFKHQQQSQQQ